ncbi:hypothetical protein SDC9_187579 [bioreactor metagenome]|uniref:Uncharacterized protein n=1 Tax=bioreactor metagenome TaxID=1076179 RepID=A0A645HV51_9ZZZZ
MFLLSGSGRMVRGSPNTVTAFNSGTDAETSTSAAVPAAHSTATFPPAALLKSAPRSSPESRKRCGFVTSTLSNSAVSTATARQSNVGVRSPSGVMERSEKLASFSVHGLSNVGHSGFQPKKMNPSAPAARLMTAFLTMEEEASHSSLTRPGQGASETNPFCRSLTACATSFAGIASSARRRSA